MRVRLLSYIGFALGVGFLCWARINQAYSPALEPSAIAPPTNTSSPLMPVERKLMHSDMKMPRALFRIADKEAAVATPKMENRPANSDQPFRLVGVIINDTVSLALIEKSGEIKRVGVGQQLEGWKVLRVGNREALLEKSDRLRHLLLDDNGAVSNSTIKSSTR